MRYMKSLLLLVLVAIMMTTIGCTTVPAGNVGVKVYLLGGDKGVDNEVLGTGRYWIGFNEQLYIYPTYEINYTYTADKTEGSESNEEFVFQSSEGLECSMDMGVSAYFARDKISTMFQTYRKGPEEIKSTIMRNAIRDALNKVASTMSVEDVYGSGKTKMIDTLQIMVKRQLDSTGIVIKKVSLIGSIRLPATVMQALNSKVTATQRAQQRENELREAEAQAAKAVAEAKGIALANEAKAKSLTTQNIEWERLQIERLKIEKWNGVLPVYTLGETNQVLSIK